jgi:hypothetical protein
VSWDSHFAEPIELPSGVRLASLRDAIVHLVNTVPSSERGTPVILTAAELITSAAERGGPIEFARIATLRALNRHVERVLNPDIVILKSSGGQSFALAGAARGPLGGYLFYERELFFRYHDNRRRAFVKLDCLEMLNPNCQFGQPKKQA